MSILGNRVLGGAGQQPYLVGRSLRFRSSASAYLNRTPSVARSAGIFTFSTWVKRGALSSQMSIFSAWSFSSVDYQCQIRFTSGDNLEFYNKWGTDVQNYITTQVFRDPSAWYHFVIAVDLTQSVGTNAIKLYVNGVQITSFSTSSFTNTFQGTAVNNNTPQSISNNVATSASYFDGYQAEVNMIGDAQLTPSSFGAYDNNGVWQPRKYGGTYGTNGFYLPFSANTTSAYATYQSDSSGTYNTLPSGSQGSTFQFPGDFTVEGWVLYTSASSGDGSVYVINDGGSNYFAFNVSMSAGVYNIYCNSGGPTASFSHGIQAGVWTHIALVRSGSTITAYTNGVSKGTITNSSTLGYSSIGFNRLGGGVVGIPRYMSNVRVVKSAVYTSNFTPPTAPLTAIANTLFLTYQNSTAIDNGPNSFAMGTAGSPTFSIQYPFSVGIANDASGNNNNWTPNNISLALGTTYDSMIDSPTVSASSSNYAVLNPLNRSTSALPATIVDGNLKLTTTTSGAGSPGSFSYAFSTFAMQSGKYYAEFIANYASGSAGSTKFGLTNNFTFNYNGGNYIASNFTSAYTQVAPGTIVQIAYDANSNLYWFGTNGTFTGDPAAGTGGTSLTAPAMFFVEGYNDSVNRIDVNANFGQRPFSYTPPSGFNPVNTYSIPQPTIMNGAKYMAATLTTGTGGVQNISNGLNNTTGVVFQPDLIWWKSRSNVTNQIWVNSISGAGPFLRGNTTDAELQGSGLTSFNSNGFSVNGSFDNTYTFVSWQWNAGSGVTSTNTSGSISSLVSVNPSAGFSMVSYVGTGAVATVGHSLGVAPNMIIWKNRSSVENWVVYHSSLGATGNVYLNLTNGFSTDSTTQNNTAPTSSVFTVATSGATNGATRNLIAYCWTAIAGYSSFGSYSGNGSSDGVYIYLGFRPRFVMVKNTTVGTPQSWWVQDSSRSTYNVVDAYLQPNQNETEKSIYAQVDFLSNGIKFRTSDNFANGSGQSYIYAAFAENPFKVSRAR